MSQQKPSRPGAPKPTKPVQQSGPRPAQQANTGRPRQQSPAAPPRRDALRPQQQQLRQSAQVRPRARVTQPPPRSGINVLYPLLIGGGLVIVIALAFILWPKGNSGAASFAGDCSVPSDQGAGKYFVVTTVKGCIVAKLYTDPSANVSKTVANFEQKANAGTFDGRIFHRVEDWVIQGGDPLGNGTGGGQMPAEYNQLPFGAGALGVARGNDPTINNDSQFFITKSAAPSLNGQYTNFGQVVAGMDVVNKIAIGDKMTRVRVVSR